MPSPACCPCGQLVGCVCGGMNCSTECRKKTGTAALCGYAEFSSPSTPPKAYKKRVTTGTMSIAKFVEHTCAGPTPLTTSCECRSKSTSANLCGYGEYMTPSTPPLAFRRQTISGQVVDCSYAATSPPTCATPTINQTVKGIFYSGSYQYDPSTCAETNTQQGSNRSGVQSACSLPGAQTSTFGMPKNIANIHCQSPNGWGHNLQTLSSVRKKVDPAFNACFEFFGANLTSISDLTLDLTDQDTASDAVARANASIDWSAPSASCSLHTSYRGQNSGDFGVSYRSGQTRATLIGTSVGMRVHAQFQIYRRVRGSGGAFVAFTTIDVFDTASGSSYTTPWKDLPQDDVYEYLMNGCSGEGNIEEDIVDTWNVTDDFGPNLPAACNPTTVDLSTRTDDGAPVIPWPWGGIIPPNAYATFATAFSSATSRITTGNNVCTIFEAAWAKFIGTVNEELSEEDTDDDAYDRAVAALTWGLCTLGCLISCAAFRSQRTTGTTFGFSAVQTRVLWTAVIGTTYKVTIRYARRVLGSSGPYLFFSLLELTITADVVDEFTDWQDVPNENGWDTIAANCTVEVVP